LCPSCDNQTIKIMRPTHFACGNSRHPFIPAERSGKMAGTLWNISFSEPRTQSENAPAPIGLHLAKTLASDPSLKLLLAKVESRMEISGLKEKEPPRIIFLSGTTCARSEPAFRTEAPIVAAIVGRTLEHFSDESFVLRAPNVRVVESERSEDFSQKRRASS
jgi:hypothetical protein